MWPWGGVAAPKSRVRWQGADTTLYQILSDLQETNKSDPLVPGAPWVEGPREKNKDARNQAQNGTQEGAGPGT